MSLIFVVVVDDDLVELVLLMEIVVEVFFEMVLIGFSLVEVFV